MINSAIDAGTEYQTNGVTGAFAFDVLNVGLSAVGLSAFGVAKLIESGIEASAPALKAAQSAATARPRSFKAQGAFATQQASFISSQSALQTDLTVNFLTGMTADVLGMPNTLK